jgi:carboxymethylenebutenolidase
MSTSRRSTSRWSKAAALALTALVAAGAPGAPPPKLPPFLQLFNDHRQTPLAARDAAVASAAGRVSAYVVRPDTPERLPAVLIVPGDEGLNEWVKESAHELAEVGYVTLAVDPPHDRAGAADEEAVLARLSAAVRWLRRRPDVLPERVGVVGWGSGAAKALSLAGSTSVQACVVCDGPVTAEPPVLAGLGRTPVLGLFAAGDAVPAFRKALDVVGVPHKVEGYDGARDGFLGPPGRPGYAHDVADRAWVEVYEFLGKYVEDAPLNHPAAAPGGPNAIATIADLMRSVNQPTGVRGSLLRDLEQEPTTARQWERVRANAALVAEAGRLLQARTPPRGPPGHWSAEAAAYTAAAEQLVGAADRRDYTAARRSLDALGTCCASCHSRHR